MKGFAVVLGALFAVCAHAADPDCSTGVKNGKFCCDSSCGDKCAVDGCDDAGEAKCCGSAITKSCNSNNPPCVIQGSTSGAVRQAPGVCDGKLSDDGEACCASSCERCEYTAACAGFTGGDQNCCPSKFTNRCGSAPCLLNDGSDFEGSGVEQPDSPPSEGSTGSTGGTERVTGNVQRNAKVAILSGEYKSYDAREAEWGTKFQGVLLYQGANNLQWDWVKTWIDRGVLVQLSIEFKGADLDDVNNGKFDAQLEAFSNKVGNANMYIRPFHEMNGNWYPWGIFTGDNTVEKFKRAFNRVAGKFSGNPNVKMQINYNNVNPNGLTEPSFEEMYPGNSVDMVCISAYNFVGTSSDHPTSRSFEAIFGAAYDKLVAFLPGDMPLCWGEGSTTSYGGDKTEWITEAWKDLAYKFTRVTVINWFLERQTDKSPNYDWDMDTDAHVSAWKNGYNLFKDATGNNRRLEGTDESHAHGTKRVKATESDL